MMDQEPQSTYQHDYKKFSTVAARLAKENPSKPKADNLTIPMSDVREQYPTTYLDDYKPMSERRSQRIPDFQEVKVRGHINAEVPKIDPCIPTTYMDHYRGCLPPIRPCVDYCRPHMNAYTACMDRYNYYCCDPCGYQICPQTSCTYDTNRNEKFPPDEIAANPCLYTAPNVPHCNGYVRKTSSMPRIPEGGISKKLEQCTIFPAAQVSQLSGFPSHKVDSRYCHYPGVVANPCDPYMRMPRRQEYRRSCNRLARLNNMISTE
ncbi:uncharacterized protein LOC129715036 isoform X3 [Leucoraja erinacea]|uniref:uncharacterized protein LOC129715036 isoform X3 n=1 Tax=Leucoraja erinaceus TaxID=7782 RepID=UPI0024575806|nr:uncharacterized protein LOC129715036 isoform X3 [Leucoraja erinacea]